MTHVHDPQTHSLLNHIEALQLTSDPNGLKQMTTEECLAWFDEMDYHDPLGHPLVLNADFIQLVAFYFNPLPAQ